MALGDICVTIFLELVRVLVIIQYFNIFYDTYDNRQSGVYNNDRLLFVI